MHHKTCASGFAAVLVAVFLTLISTTSLVNATHGLPRGSELSAKSQVQLAASIIPPNRATTRTNVELTVMFPRMELVDLTVTLVSGRDPSESIQILRSNFTGPVPARFPLRFASIPKPFLNIANQIVVNATSTLNSNLFSVVVISDYEIFDTGVNSTRLIDGAFIDIHHFSDSEALYYQQGLLEMTAQDWYDQMQYMSAVGIKIAVIQALFLNNEYPGSDSDATCYDFPGYSYYPSLAFPDRMFPNFTNSADKLEAILSAADKLGIKVFVGIGIFAWFEFNQESLCWHLRVAEEVHKMYGHHASFYGWYIAEEMAGNFFCPGPYCPPDLIPNMHNFFKVFKEYVNSLTVLPKPIMFACNSYQWSNWTTEWRQVLQHVDILAPFALARDPAYHTLPSILETCEAMGVRVWVDMELFQDDPVVPLRPKSILDLMAEILEYDAVEQIIGYEFTGLMDSPQSRVHLGGKPASVLYSEYQLYYRHNLKK